VTQLRNVVNNSQILFFWTDSFEVNCSKEPIRINESDFLSLVVSKRGPLTGAEAQSVVLPSARLSGWGSVTVCLYVSDHITPAAPLPSPECR